MYITKVLMVIITVFGNVLKIIIHILQAHITMGVITFTSNNRLWMG